MSTRPVRTQLLLARETFRAAPLRRGVLGLMVAGLTASQLFLPLAGTFLVAMAVAWIRAASLGGPWIPHARPLAGLGLLNSPVTGLWIILWSYNREIAHDNPLVAWWMIPILFFIAVAQFVETGAAREILGGASVDKALAQSWKRTVAKRGAAFGCAALLAILFWLCFVSRGWGFLVVAPLGLAVEASLEKD